MKKNNLVILFSLILLFNSCYQDSGTPDDTEEIKYGPLDTIKYLFKYRYLWKDNITLQSDNKIEETADGLSKYISNNKYSGDKWSYFSKDYNPSSSIVNNSPPSLSTTSFQFNSVYIDPFKATKGRVLHSLQKWVCIFNVRSASKYFNVLKRGDIIVEINGKSPNDYSNFSSFYNNSTSFDSIKVRRHQLDDLGYIYPDKYTDFTIKNIIVEEYKEESKPVSNDTIFENNGRKVGYFFYSSFVGENTGYDNLLQVRKVFHKFKDNGAQSIIIDLRYNGGGYDYLSTYMASLLIDGNDGDVLVNKTTSYGSNFSESINDKVAILDGISITNGVGPKPTFDKLYILVSKYTASAAEIFCMTLKPYLVDKLVIIGEKTEGKFVGGLFNDIGSVEGEKNYFYMIQFESKNRDKDPNIIPFTYDYSNTSLNQSYWIPFDDSREWWIHKALEIDNSATPQFKTLSQSFGMKKNTLSLDNNIINRPLNEGWIHLKE